MTTNESQAGDQAPDIPGKTRITRRRLKDGLSQTSVPASQPAAAETDSDQTVSQSRDLTHSPRPVEKPLRPKAIVEHGAELRQEFADAHANLVTKLDAWLSSLEGRRFEWDDAQTVVESIRVTVRAAGRQLTCGGEPVALACSRSQKAKHATIQVRTVGSANQTVRRGRVEFPKLTSGPIE